MPAYDSRPKYMKDEEAAAGFKPLPTQDEDAEGQKEPGPPPAAASKAASCGWKCCCYGCSFCCCCNILIVIALVSLLIPGFFSLWFAERLCLAKKCLNVFDEERADSCLACRATFDAEMSQLVVGANGVPFGYYWLAMGALADDFNLTVVQDYDEIKRLAGQMPSRIHKGEWWRGNELGGIVNNPFFWSGLDIWPQSIVLGSTSGQHSSVRPFMVEAFKVNAPSGATGRAGGAKDDWIRTSMREFLAERKKAKKINVPDDLIAWTHQILYENAFDKKISFEAAQEFVTVQQNQIRGGTASQVLPARLYHSVGGALGLPEARDAAARHVERYLPLVNRLWGDELRKRDCSPSVNCSYQLAAAVWDVLVSAGGLSVPGGLHSGLAMMYSTSATNPVPQDFNIAKGEERNFFWETIRFIPPVYGFPFWLPRPTCVGQSQEETLELNKPDGESQACPRPRVDEQTGFSPVNQWIQPRGGHRQLLALVSGQKEAKVWGDPETFRVRPLADYDKFSVGFAEPAVDNDVDDGNSNRDCPGKELALVIGQIFWEEFSAELDLWEPENSDIQIDPLGPFVQVPAFVLKPKGEKKAGHHEGAHKNATS